MPKYFCIYVNPAGRAAMLSKTPVTFPEGSIIVKEKFNSKDAGKPELLTIMVKHPAGYDRAHGDWEYQALSGAGQFPAKFSSVVHCQNCHDAVAESGYVYRSYMPHANYPTPERSRRLTRQRLFDAGQTAGL